MTNALVLAGANRGGRGVTSELQRTGLTRALRRVEVIDPTPGRARELGRVFEREGAQVRAFETQVEDVLQQLHPSAPTVLSVDNPRSAAAAARGRVLSAPTLVQLVSQPLSSESERGTTLALTALLDRDRPREHRAVQELFDRFAELSPERRSSALIRSAPVSALALQRSRMEASRHTVEKLSDLDRARDEERLSAVLWRGQEWALLVAHSMEVGVGRERELAYAQPVRKRGVVALLRSDGGVSLLLIERNGAGRPYLRARFSYDAPPPLPVSAPTLSDPTTTAAQPAPRVLFTD